jgi:hypothetical protein
MELVVMVLQHLLQDHQIHMAVAVVEAQVVQEILLVVQAEAVKAVKLVGPVTTDHKKLH